MSDERRHPGAGEERWWFDFAAADGSIGGYVRLAYRDREAWWWAAVTGAGAGARAGVGAGAGGLVGAVGAGAGGSAGAGFGGSAGAGAGGPDRLVAVRAHDLRVPARGTEIRGDGVWASLNCETPLEHWSVGLESFGAAFDDPAVAEGDERGDVVPFGLDLEWEASAPAVGAAEGYGQWCEVHGEVLLGDDRLSVAATGWRAHGWGSPRAAPWWRVAVGGGVVCEPGDGGVVVDARGMPVAVADVTVVAVSPVLVPGERVVHALGRSAGGAYGWLSWWGLRRAG